MQIGCDVCCGVLVATTLTVLTLDAVRTVRAALVPADLRGRVVEVGEELVHRVLALAGGLRVLKRLALEHLLLFGGERAVPAKRICVRSADGANHVGVQSLRLAIFLNRRLTAHARQVMVAKPRGARRASPQPVRTRTSDTRLGHLLLRVLHKRPSVRMTLVGLSCQNTRRNKITRHTNPNGGTPVTVRSHQVGEEIRHHCITEGERYIAVR